MSNADFKIYLEEEEAAVLSSAMASALAESASQSASTGEAEIKSKPETIKQTNHRKDPSIKNFGKSANVTSNGASVAKANPSDVKPVPVKAKSPPVFGSLPSSSFEPVLSEQPQELKWDVRDEEKAINAYEFKLPVFADSNNILPTDNPAREIREPLIESMSTAPTPSGLFTIPSEMKDDSQPVPNLGLFNFSSPSINLSVATEKEGKYNGADIPTENQDLASPQNDIENMTVEQILKMIREGQAVMTEEVVSEEVPALDAAVGPDAIPQDISEGSPGLTAEEILEGVEYVIEHAVESDAPRSSPDSDRAQWQLIGFEELKDEFFINNLDEWYFYAYETPNLVGYAGPYKVVQLVACNKFYELDYVLEWDVPYHWGEPKPLHLQESPRPSNFLEFPREIMELPGEDSPAGDVDMDAEIGRVTVEVDDVDLSIITDSLVMTEELQPENSIYDAVSDVPQPSSAESRMPPVENHYYTKYNIRENVLFFLKNNESDTVGNTDNSPLSMAESTSSPVEEQHTMDDATPVVPQENNIREKTPEISIAEQASASFSKYYDENDAGAYVPHDYNIRENVLFFLPPENKVSKTIEDSNNPQISIKESGSSSVEKYYDVNDAGSLVPHDYNIGDNVLFFLPPADKVSDAIGKIDAVPSVHQDLIVDENASLPEVSENSHVLNTVMESGSDRPIDDACSERGSDGASSPVSQDLSIRENVLPDEGYDIMKNVYFFMSKKEGVSDRATESTSDNLNDNTNSVLQSREKDNATEDAIESLDVSHNESISQSGTLVVGPNDLEGQEQLRKAIWDSRNASTRFNHSHNVSSVTTGTSSSMNELNSVPSVTSMETAEEHTDSAEVTSNTEDLEAHSENTTLPAPVEFSHEGSSIQQEEETNKFVYNFGSTTVWVGKQGLEVGKAAATVMFMPLDLAIQATISGVKKTKTGFLIGRWACALFGPRWLGRLVGA